MTGQPTGRYFIDSTKLQVCDNLRIHSHQVFKDIAKRGKTSTGWFFGFKLHLAINHKGDLMSFKLTPGNVDDRAVVDQLTKDLKGWLFGDKGYINSKLSKTLKDRELELITRPKKKMKDAPLSPTKQRWLDKRGVVESVIDQLKSIVHIQHTRHRSPNNLITSLFAGLLAYILKPEKPSVSFSKSLEGCALLMSS
jgi:hypothetical protein